MILFLILVLTIGFYNIAYASSEIVIDYNTIGHQVLIDGISQGTRNLEIGTTKPIILIKKMIYETAL